MDKRGVSLLEILVSTVLLAMLVTGLMNVVISGKRWLIHNRSRATASQLGKTFLAPLYMDVVANPVDPNCLNLGSNCLSASTIGGVTYSANYVTGGAVPGGFTGVRKAVVNISWTDIEPRN